ncbi:MAG: ABC transporter permease [Lentisphaeria bacterium]|nr:ABC transporter permease [Lentisphaeria bacterium]
MFKRAEFFLALRYLKPERSAVGVITVISIVGVALGVAVLMIVLAVMTGFTDLMKEKILDTQAHLQVRSTMYYSFQNPYRYVEMIEKLGGRAFPVINAPALMQYGRRLEPSIFVMGVDTEDLAKCVDLKKVVVAGDFQLERGEIALSSTMAARLMLGLGDKILLHSPRKLTGMVKISDSGKVELNEKNPVYLPSEFTVKAVYSFNKSDFDRSVIFIPIDDAAKLFDLRTGSATAVFGYFDDPYNMQSELNALNRDLRSSNMRALSWQETNSALLGVLAVEKRMMFFLLIFIVLVAAFSITNTLITSVYKKTKEIGILKALGATGGTCMRIFVYQGMFVGLIGTICGTVLGYLVLHFRNNILDFASRIAGHDLFPKEFYYFDGLPAKIITSDVVLICAAAILLCTLGAVIPAIRAAKLDPAKALRYE